MFFSQDGEHETDDLSSQGADERDRSSIRGGSPFVEREREANLSSCDMDLTRTVMEGWLDKCGQSLVMSKWTHRWCVLNGTSFIYYVDESKAVQKGAYVIDDSCKVVTEDESDKKRVGGRNNVISLQRPNQLSGGGYDLLLSCKDQDHLRVWESALSGVIACLRQRKEAETIFKKSHAPRLSVILDTILDATTGSGSSPAREDSLRRDSVSSLPPEKGESIRTPLERKPSFFRRRSTLKSSQSGSCKGLPSGTETIDTSELLKSSVKDGHLLKRSAGENEFSENYCVLSPSSISFFGDNSLTERRGTVTFTSSHYLTRLTTDKKLKSVSGSNGYFLSLHTRGTGKNFTSKTSDTMLCFSSAEQQLLWEEKIYNVLFEHLQATNSVVVKVQQDREGGVPNVDEPIFKISLMVEASNCAVEQYHHYIDIREVYSKLKHLSSGIVTAVFPKVHKRSAYNIRLNEDEIENRIVGLQNWLQDLVTNYSKFDYLNFIGEINDVQVDIAAIFGTNPNTLKSFIKDVRAKKAAAIAPPPLPKSKIMALFQKYEDDGDDPISSTPVALPDGTSGGDRDGNDDDLRMPSSAEKLVLYNIKQLAKLCGTHDMECREFKCKKDYMNALATTYQKALPYLHNKEARPIVQNLVQTLELKPLSINDDAVNIEIDKLFIDLMRKLNVPENLLGILSMEYNSFEKLDRIKRCVSIWDAHLFFTVEDRALLLQFSSDRYLDSFSVLNLKSRIKMSEGEGWLHRWCVLRGIPALITRIDTIVEQDPLLEVDAVNLLQLLKIFRSIIETDCRYELVGTRGAIEALVMTICFKYKALAIESLNLLSELIVFGGTEAVWQMINGFKHLAFVRKEEFFQVLVDGILEQDITVQCPILSLINSVLLYEGDINARVKLRSQLHVLKFEDICTVFKKEYTRMAKVVMSSDSGEGSYEDQIRDKIDRLLFGGTRFQKKSTTEVARTDATVVEEAEYFREDCRKLQLRPGVEIKEYDFGSSLAEDFDTDIHPEEGVMEGHMVAIAEKSNPDEDLGAQSWEGVVKRVTRRLSFQGEAKTAPQEDDIHKYDRYWYELHENLLIWYNLADKTDSFRERAGTLDVSRVVDILDYSSLTKKVKVPLQNIFSLVLCDEDNHLHMYSDSLETKHKWMLAIRVVQKRMSHRKCAYRLPKSIPLESTATLKLQKDFDTLFSIYESVAKEDVAAMYSTTIADIIDPSSGALPYDPVAVVRFMDLELRKHRNASKLKSLLTDIAGFVNDNYCPKEEEEEEEEEEEVKIIHPLAVPDSDRPIAKAPPLPYIPADKPPRVPGKKVKQLFWTKVKPVNVWKSVWEGMEEPDLSWNKLDENFGEVLRRRKAISSNHSSTPADVKHQQISLFDGKRTQNAAIACGKLRKSPEEIFDLIVNLDPEELTQEVNETIVNLLLPTDEEIAALRAYTGKVEDLDFCGRLFSYLTEVDRLEPRLRVQQIMLSWNDEASVVFDQVNIVKLSLEEINDPESLESFEVILACVLAAGNYMNGKSNRGQAHGYKLDILPKLRNIKQVNLGKKTFLHFIIGQSRLHFPEHISFYEKWNFMWKSPKVILKNLENIVSELQADLNVCVAEIEAAESIESEQCRTPLMENLGSFITQASESLQELSSLLEEIDFDVRQCKKYFSEASVPAALTTQDDDPWCSFFSLFVNFANMHRLSSVELEEWDKAEERVRKNAEARKLRNHSRSGAGGQAKKKSAIGEGVDGGSSRGMIASRDSVSSLDSTSSLEKRGGGGIEHGEGNMIDMFKKKMLVIRKTADAVNDEGNNGSDSDSDDGAW